MTKKTYRICIAIMCLCVVMVGVLVAVAFFYGAPVHINYSDLFVVTGAVVVTALCVFDGFKPRMIPKFVVLLICIVRCMIKPEFDKSKELMLYYIIVFGIVFFSGLFLGVLLRFIRSLKKKNESEVR